MTNKDNHINKVIQHLYKNNTTERDALERFIRLLYQHLPSEDLLAINILDLYGAALANWQFIQTYDGTVKIKICNPHLEENGWQSTHTVLVILTKNMPFLVDSIRMTLTQSHVNIHLISHPVLHCQRDNQGILEKISVIHNQTSQEALIYVEIDHITENETMAALQTKLIHIIENVELGVADWVPMCDTMSSVIESLGVTSANNELINEQIDFLKWINNDNFIFLAYQKLTINSAKRVIADSVLGLFKNTYFKQDQVPQSKNTLLQIMKSPHRSPINRPEHMDSMYITEVKNSPPYITHQFLGLFTAPLYNRSVMDIPLLRYKVNTTMKQCGFEVSQHSYRVLLNLLETYPRDELLQISKKTLLQNSHQILHLQNRSKTRLFINNDPFYQFYTCLVFFPREHYNTQIRKKMERILLNTFSANEIEFTINLSDSVLAKVYFIILTKASKKINFDFDALEKQFITLTLTWESQLETCLLEQHGEEKGISLFRKYQQCFSTSYREDFYPRMAIIDIAHLEKIDNHLELSLYWPSETVHKTFRFKLFSQSHIALSKILPILENMGVMVIDERPYEFHLPTGHLWCQDFGLKHNNDCALDHGLLKIRFQETFNQIWLGNAENDPFNRLLLISQLNWREISVLRAYSKYMRQVGITFSQDYMAQTLINNPNITILLLDLFLQRFDPFKTPNTDSLIHRIEKSFDDVESLDEDRILRRFLGIILATLRCNYFQNKDHSNYLVFKMDSAKVPDLPPPHPMVECFVYSPEVEGIHLRGGKVARGGLRWSDRKEDFRTEVLGLVKAQMVKNALIVPVGSKGGFVVKQSDNLSRDAFINHGIHCYKIFIRGLLDITDNRVNQTLIPPPNTRCYDAADPYLVVAADKGTATFSDIANALASEYKFWLDDAFASGGSVGYDHKKMGITARGAWECVKRHFREDNIDIQNTPFTVLGIGDMAGDVFGNGMLLSPMIKLIAAFNHLHIFIDPDPDIKTSFAERQRLFQLPRSSWQDYNPSLLSKGAGIYSRQQKSMTLSKEALAVLNMTESTLTPNQLINRLLQAPVDLLWNGGIGTYVKASFETHADTGDRSNDSLRIDANQLRCKVIGEGGNLGFTQNSRIEYALLGGKINTDAIDNSAGVDCSDHEVNIKIALNQAIHNEEMTRKQRDHLLKSMTDEVASLVLRNNYQQSQSISLSLLQSKVMLDVHDRFINHLETDYKLDRDIEYLPHSQILAQRKENKQGLTRPELAVLLSYAKMKMYDDLLLSEIANNSTFQTLLVNYFPQNMRSQPEIQSHSLKNEIICTQLVNQVIDFAGITFIYRLEQDTGFSTADITLAFFTGCKIFEIFENWQQIEALDNQIEAETQYHLLLILRRLAERATRWLLRHASKIEPDKTILRFHQPVQALQKIIPDLIDNERQALLSQQKQYWTNRQVPQNIAKQVVCLDISIATLDIISAAEECQCPIATIAKSYFQLGALLNLPWLHQQISELSRSNQWKSLSRLALRDDLIALQRALSSSVLQLNKEKDRPVSRILHDWQQQNQSNLTRYMQLMQTLKAATSTDLSMLSVILRELRNLLIGSESQC